ncbi:MAG: ABC transporter ATP-binding protein [Pseudomonadota bacterium]
MAAGPGGTPTASHVLGLVVNILKPEGDFLGLTIIYGLGISLLSLATPIAVQVLINSVGYTGLTVPLIVVSFSLFGLLLASGLLNALRVHLMEVFARRLYARLTSEIALKALYAQKPFFRDDGRSVLFNRYFDIQNVQKAVPVLLVSGFTVLLQAAVGFVLTAFYHPLFLAFNAVVIGLIWLILLIWGGSAVKSAVELSQNKHRTGEWLQGLADSNGYFKSERHIAYALRRTDDVTCDYVTSHRKHFRRHFAQTVSFLVLYAAASASLLGLGGWLVIQGQLTLGQLVAAELVLAVAFFGVSQLGTYLNYFYDLCAASEELSLLDAIELEEPTGAEAPSDAGAELVFDSVRGEARGTPARIHMTIPGGAQIQAMAETHGMQRLFTNLLKRFEEPKGGTLTIGGHDITSMDVLALRQRVRVIDRPNLVEMTMRSYLQLSSDEVTSAEMLDVLRLVGLDSVIEELEDGLDTYLSSTAWPLSVGEAMRLKLAGALLAKPKIIVLNQLFDTVKKHELRDALANLKAKGADAPTVIVFSSGRVDLGLGHYLDLGVQKQSLFSDHRSFAASTGTPQKPETSARDIFEEV